MRKNSNKKAHKKSLNKNKKATLEAQLQVPKGTNEYSNHIDLLVERRNLTGVNAIKKKARAFKIVALIAKPFSIIGSGFGFATISTLTFDGSLFSTLFYILLVVGLAFGTILEYLSTANEDIFTASKKGKMFIIGLFILLSVKSYAIYMHYQTKESINALVSGAIVQSKIEDSIEVSTIKKEINDIEKSIKQNEALITDDLIKNTTSIFVNKRETAIKQLNSIRDRIKQLKEELKIKNRELINATNNNINSKKANSLNNSKATVIVSILIFLEIIGTLTSILASITVLSNTSPVMAERKEVKDRLINSQSVKKENDLLIETFKISQEALHIKEQVRLGEKEAQILINKQKMEEDLKLKELEMKNKEMELTALAHEVRANKINNAINQIKKDMEMEYIDADLELEDELIEFKKGSRTIGFKAKAPKSEDLIKRLFNGGEIKEGEKLIPKSKVINLNDPTAVKKLRKVYKKLRKEGHIAMRGQGRNGGYYATSDVTSALSILN